MGLIEGESLAELRNREAGPLGVRRAVEIVADLAEALAHAHRQGIVHRDVKPLNIQLDQTGQVYLMDFGIAYRPDSGEVCVERGKRIGTPAYVAPELVRGFSQSSCPQATSTAWESFSTSCFAAGPRSPALRFTCSFRRRTRSLLHPYPSSQPSPVAWPPSASRCCPDVPRAATPHAMSFPQA